jgi:hypothetical protein
MRAVRLIAILWVVLFASGVSVARAGEITDWSDPPAGPGCASVSCLSNIAGSHTGQANNDDYLGAGSSNPNTIDVTEYFYSINYIDVTFTVIDSDETHPGDNGITEYFSTNFAINNVSGVTWTGFQWSLFPGAVNPAPIKDDELDFDTDLITPAAFSDTFASALRPTQDTLVYTGGTLAPGATVKFEFSIDVPDTCGGIPGARPACTSFTLRGLPVAPTGVPEPSALLLLGSGLAGLGLWRRWHS